MHSHQINEEATMADSDENATRQNRSNAPAPNYPRNDNGLTYGSSADATSPGNEPDLIQAMATNGKSGYVYRTDLTPPEPASPEEAVAQNALNDEPKVISVYEQDGATVIGEFVLAAPSQGNPHTW